MAEKEGGNLRRRIIAFVALGIMVLGAWYFTRLAAGFGGAEPVWVHIPRHASVEEAKDSIRSALGDSFGSMVALLWNQDVEASHGAYKIEPGERAWKVARRLDQRNENPVRLTFNNQRTFEQLSETLASKLDFSASDFIEAARRIEAADSLDDVHFEAQFLPDTYEVYWSATPDDVIAKIRSNYRRFWNAERLEKARNLGLTPLQVSVLASIVEWESLQKSERPTIARLYLNRLNRGMKLQADPTVVFANGDFTVRRVTADMLRKESPYNTYRYAGLPPGVIRLPEAQTIDQVLNAPANNYLYMCARPDGSGFHDFTASYTDHLSNARKYRQAVYASK